ncbi:MAG: sugar transferase [Turicibacter sanguinis]|uniref:sugar transferase n=1 Tax=Turicibacter TaxID=191303 RepID=UPI001046CB8F|nr:MULTISPECIES: sugar transferase [Turicibacter]MBP3904786.1 sugar transferase [Turicibacter sp.]MCU7212145.1 sugar transferase [Turicibacter sanguinis]MDB8551667.1 sugar transferase [Turicibacter sanguinis]MTN44590.1 sugar transferase [Turicibacter sanguinis]MTN50438.1 sugar transferase [Turicibacter sanguinis]
MRKRVFDIVMSLVLIILLSPVILLVAVLVGIKMGWPVFFVQERVGKDNQIFKIYKFRTMSNSVDKKGQPLSDEMRLTKFGQFLRQTSLDELPELFNILKGEMSFVGPRPLLVEYLLEYDEHQIRRHEIRPGLTGWAQVNGRNLVSWEERFNLDVWYVDHRHFGLDLKILWMTVIKVLKREGISQEGQVTMEKFKRRIV